MFKIPQPVQRLFDSVPLKVYQNASESISPEKLYSFSLENPINPLILGVYNTFEHGKYVLPTDPVSLFTLIILAKKNGFGLPDLNSESMSGITRIPFRGSPSNSLPILISDGSVRVTENSEQIGKRICSNNINSEKFLIINEFVDTVLFDSWISCLLVEMLKPETFYRLFGISNELELYEIEKQIPEWNNFSVRHASLFEHYQNGQYLRAFYVVQCDAFEAAIKRLKGYLASSDQESSIIKYKLAAFVIIFDHFLKETKMGEILSRFPEVITKSYAVLES